jgi:hypothetical protein
MGLGDRLAVAFGRSPEAEIAGSGILANVSRHVRPPVVSGDQLKCLPPSGMPGNMAIVVEGHNFPSDVRSGGNIDLTAEVEHSVHFRPFGRADGTSGSVFQCFNCLSYCVL